MDTKRDSTQRDLTCPGSCTFHEAMQQAYLSGECDARLMQFWDIPLPPAPGDNPAFDARMAELNALDAMDRPETIEKR